MCKSCLRKVSFRFTPYEFHPDRTETEEKEMEELSKEREGYFHCWTEDVDTSKEIPYIKKMALVENPEDGSIHMVESCNLHFKD